MALINCPECGRENVSNNAKSCPNCGYSLIKYAKQIEKAEKQKQAYEKKQRKKEDKVRKKEDKRRNKEEKKKNKKSRVGIIVLLLIILFFIVGIYFITIYPNTEKGKYNKAVDEYNSQEYISAIQKFEEIEEYKDSSILLTNCKYAVAMEEYNQGNYKEAINICLKIPEHSEASELINKCRHLLAEQYYEQKNYDDSLEMLSLIGNTTILELQNKNKYAKGLIYLADENYLEAYECVRTLKEEYLLELDNYNIGDLAQITENCINQILNRGKELYDQKIYVDAYTYLQKYYYVTLEKPYEEAYTVCELISKIQGTLYDSWYNELYVDNTTITVPTSHYYIDEGTYTTQVMKYTQNDTTQWRLVFEGTDYYLDISSFYWYVLHGKNNKTQSFYFLDDINRINNYNQTVRENQKKNEVIKKEPAIGMTASEVENSTWGKPDEINKTTYAWGTTEQWCYSNYRYIYFDNGRVTAISE